ncbi:MAG: ATP-binding protein [Kangiellaceae bacterium]|nr:ATP-binding protein [Kangiellaceae bacterium]MCW9018461.1 ATP-binding protein [Kangiellaceae bacterium]
MKRLFIRFYLGVTAAIILSLLVAGILLDQRYQKSLAQEYLANTRALHDHVAKELSGSDEEEWPQILARIQKKYDYYIETIELDSLPLANRQQLESNGNSIIVETGFIEDEVFVYYRLPATQQVISYTDKDISYEEYNWIVLWYLIALMLAIAAAVYALARPIARHVFNLAKVSKQFGEGDFKSRADENAPYPLDHLAKAFNRMSQEITQLIKEQEVMTGAVSHELRTPMANLRFALDMTRNIDNVKALREHIEEMDQDIESMEKLIDELLTYARMKRSADFETAEPAELEPELSKAVRQIEKLRDDINITVKPSLKVSHPIFKRDFQRALLNILRNAQKYANSKIEIVIEQSPDNLTIHIDDDGPGIPLEQREDIFIPFKRLDQSRSKESGGYGLGLAIVERIVAKHKGKVTIDTSPLGGARFSFIFPI